ncbi:hypothetical protein [Bacteroides sedimenti]|uniref:hypothetical protein n=1 Tax=Bacteroides sedimenti TaxID=2136147 RepID=UPI00333FE0D7
MGFILCANVERKFKVIATFTYVKLVILCARVERKFVDYRQEVVIMAVFCSIQELSKS